jgi:hypothetical protein
LILSSSCPDVNWTHNEFPGDREQRRDAERDDRIGAGLRTDRFNWGIYAGPMYQSPTEDLIILG